MTAKLIMTTNMMVKFVMMINMMAKLIMTTNLMSLIMMMVKMMNKMSRMTIAVLVVAVKLKLSCLVQTQSSYFCLFFNLNILNKESRKEREMNSQVLQREIAIFFSQIFSGLADGDDLDDNDMVGVGDDDKDDLNESQRYGDKAEAEIGDGKVGDEHIPGFPIGIAHDDLQQ